MGNGRSDVTTSETVKHATQPGREGPGRTPLLPNRELLFREREHASVLLHPPPSKENIQGPPTRNPNSQLEAQTEAAGSKPGITRGPHSLGPAFKGAPSKVFKKLPAGANGAGAAGSLGGSAGEFQWRRRRGRSLNDPRTSLGKGTVKSAVSCEELDKRDAFERVGARRWHSTEALTNRTSRCLERQQGPSRWEEEPEDKREAASDCESLFSLDSLSSAYAAALAEQLQHEEAAYSDAESQDSRMSADSLTVDGVGHRPATKGPSQPTAPSYPRGPGGSYLSMRNGWSTAQATPPVLPPPESGDAVKGPGRGAVLTDPGASATAAGAPRIPRRSPSPQQPALCYGADGISSPGPRRCSPTSTRGEDVGVKGQEIDAEGPKNTAVRLRCQERQCFTPNADPKDAVCQVEPSDRQKENVCRAPAASTELRTTSTAVGAAAVPLDARLAKNASAGKPRPVFWDEQAVTFAATLPPNAVSSVSRPSGTALSTSATDQDLRDKEPDVSVALKPSGETEVLGRSDGAGGLQNEQGGDFRKYEIFARRHEPDATESEGSEQLTAPQQKPVGSASRKRNKEQPDLSLGSLKMPKRSEGSGVVASCALPPASQRQVWQDSNNNSVESCLCVSGQSGVTSGSERKEQSGRTADKEASDGLGGRPQVSGDSEEQPPRVDHHAENQQPAQHVCKSGAIFTAIDSRISQMVKELMGLSLSVDDDDDGSKSRTRRTGPPSSPSSACFFASDEEDAEEPGDGERRENAGLAPDRPVTKKNGHESNAPESPEAARRQRHRTRNSSHPSSDTSKVSGNAASRTLRSEPPEPEGSAHSGTAGGGSSSAGRRGFRPDGSAPEEGAATLETCLSSAAPQIQTRAARVDADLRLRLGTSSGDPKGGRGHKRVTHVASINQHCCSLKRRTVPNLQGSPGSAPCRATSRPSPGGGLRTGQNPSAHEDLDGFALGSGRNQSCGLDRTSTWKLAQERFSCTQSRPNSSAEAHVNSAEGDGEARECVWNARKGAAGRPSEGPELTRGSVPPQRKSPAAPPTHGSPHGPEASGRDQLNPSGDHRRLSAASFKKVKRLRRAQTQTRPPSSSGSSLGSSDEQEDDVASRLLHTRLPTKCVTAHGGKQQIGRDRNADTSAPVSPAASKMKACLRAKNSTPQRRPLPPQAMSGKATADKSALCTKNAEDQRALQSPDSLLRFASSDVDPFVHQRQDGDADQRRCENRAFGSAADLTRKSALPSSAGRLVSRCCSVDDGLNGQASPFRPHLGACAGRQARTTLACSSSSGEMASVYSSEPESAENAARSWPSPTGGQERHRRSRTDGAAAPKTGPGVRGSPTWASMENMSAQLSKLIDSTSDLLEDVQGMRSGQGLGAKGRRSSAPGRSSGSSRRDGSTQTATRGGLRPPGPPEVVATEEPRPREIRLLVRVMASETAEQVTSATGASVGGRLDSASQPSPPEPPRPENAAVSKSPLLSSKRRTAYTDRALSPIRTLGPRVRLKRAGRVSQPQRRSAEEGLTGSSGQLSSRSLSEDAQTPQRDSDGPPSEWEPVRLERDAEVSTLYSGTGSFGFLGDGHTDAERSSGRLSPRSPPGGVNGEQRNAAEHCLGSLWEDDAFSLAASECDTDVLVNVKPITALPPCWDQRLVPEDLPLHNKFTNWSGIGRQPSQPPPTKVLTKDPPGSSPAEASSRAGRTREIQRLRQEREQVMATVLLGLSPTSLTVELAEAKLHYGLGETDALLKVLTPRPAQEPEAPPKLRLYERWGLGAFPSRFSAPQMFFLASLASSPQFLQTSQTPQEHRRLEAGERRTSPVPAQSPESESQHTPAPTFQRRHFLLQSRDA